MDRNEITRRSLLSGALALPLASLAARATAQQPTPPPSGPFSLPALAYPFAALEPHIDALTMQIHHDRHHQTYINNLNVAMAKVFGPNTRVMSAEVLLKRLERIPEDSRTAVRNNAGGHVNHTLFWSSMKPAGGGAPTGPIADAIKGTFGDYEKFKAAFEDAGLKRFGSGWVWLYIKQGKLTIGSYANQDNPLIDGDIPILGNDVWEHAYYLKYQNKRADYLKAWWNVVNWDEVNKRFKEAI